MWPLRLSAPGIELRHGALQERVRQVDARLRATALRMRDPALLPGPLRAADAEQLCEALGADPWSLVEQVHAARAHAASEREARGRCLVFFPHLPLFDGAAEAASGGFFDTYNLPPWETWLVYVDDGSRDVHRSQYLLAWVPDRFEPAADHGLIVNPEACIAWIEDARVRAVNLF